jgi:hypothetical protein
MIHATVPVTIIPFLTREVGNTMEGNPWQIEIMQAGIMPQSCLCPGSTAYRVSSVNNLLQPNPYSKTDAKLD